MPNATLTPVTGLDTPDAPPVPNGALNGAAPRVQGPLERAFESFLWTSRLMTLIAVLASLLMALGAFLLATMDVSYMTRDLLDYLTPNLADDVRQAVRAALVTNIVKAVDGYLFAAILLIFALGLYELFVSKIERAENSDFATRLLRLRSIDDLKDRLAKVILLILVVKFFQQALEVKYASALDLLYLGLGILFVGAALFISGVKLGKKSSDH